jgi:hypothetical protein
MAQFERFNANLGQQRGSHHSHLRLIVTPMTVAIGTLPMYMSETLIYSTMSNLDAGTLTTTSLAGRCVHNLHQFSRQKSPFENSDATI